MELRTTPAVVRLPVEAAIVSFVDVVFTLMFPSINKVFARYIPPFAIIEAADAVVASVVLLLV